MRHRVTDEGEAQEAREDGVHLQAQEAPKAPAPLIPLSRLPASRTETINVHALTHPPTRGTLLQQPLKTETPCFPKVFGKASILKQGLWDWRLPSGAVSSCLLEPAPTQPTQPKQEMKKRLRNPSSHGPWPLGPLGPRCLRKSEMQATRSRQGVRMRVDTPVTAEASKSSEGLFFQTEKCFFVKRPGCPGESCPGDATRGVEPSPCCKAAVCF